MSDFPTAWQNYFTALDELAKAVVRRHEAHAALPEGDFDSPMTVFADHQAEWRSKDFYRAHLALKPFLEDDSE